MANYLNIIGSMGQRVNPNFLEGVDSLTDINPQFGVSNRSYLNAMASAGLGKTGNVQTAANDVANNSSKWSQMNQILGTNYIPSLSSSTLDPRLSSAFTQGVDPAATNPTLGVPNTLALNAMANLGYGSSGNLESSLSNISANPTLLQQMNKILGTNYAPAAPTTPNPPATPVPTPPSVPPASTPPASQNKTPTVTSVGAGPRGSNKKVIQLSDGTSIEWGGAPVNIGDFYKNGAFSK